MEGKTIKNIVFYTLSTEKGLTKKAAIFYSDGSIEDTTYDAGIDACEQVAKERNIQSKDAFREMINQDIIHVMSGEEFARRFASFIPEQPQSKPVEEKSTRSAEDIFFTDFSAINPDDLNASPTNDADDTTDEDVLDEDIDGTDSDAEDDDIDTDENENHHRGLVNGIRVGLACAVALAIGCGMYSCAKKQSKEGAVETTTLPAVVVDIDSNNNNNQLVADGETVAEKHYYNDATIKGLLESTKDEAQKNAMNNLGTAMDGFNNVFASYYIEKGLDVRPALKFEELVALQLAYNDYSRDKLASIYNGADLRSEDLSRAYRDANLQLMGAYAIENSKHPVDMSMLIESEQGKEFYKRYHDAFLAAKEATGEEKIRLVKAFYDMVRHDFAVSEKERTEGISHAENYEKIKPYQFAVAPMIAAAEMMWQNLSVDFTLDDLEVDFLNDLGLCNHADKTFERVEILILSNPANTENPTFQQYQIAFVAYGLGIETYYVDDEHRELTKLQSFQDAVNWHFEMDGEATYQGHTTTSTETHTETHTRTVTSTTYSEETETRQIPITPEAKAKVDAELEAQNEAARRQAEAAAEAERQRLQAEEDKHAAEVEAEVKKDEEDLSKKISDANDTINSNNADNNPANDTPVNENDLGHGVEFDDQHSDGNGNLDSSVSNITVDPSGDKTDEPLPDPNKTGEEFDAKGAKMKAPARDQGTQTTSADQPAESQPVDTTPSSNDQWIESTEVDPDYYFEDAWVEYDVDVIEDVEYDVPVVKKDVEHDVPVVKKDVEYADAINSFVESMVGDQTESKEGYQYRISIS